MAQAIVNSDVRQSMDQAIVDNFIRAAWANDISTIWNMLEDNPHIIDRRQSEFHEAVVELLVERGADLNAQDKVAPSDVFISYIGQLGWTALMFGSKSGDTTIIEYLLKHGADINIKNLDDKTALTLAKSDYIRNILKRALEELPPPAVTPSPATAAPAQPTAVSFPPNPPIRAPPTIPASYSFHTIQSGDIAISDIKIATGLSDVYRGKYRGTDVAIKMLRRGGPGQLSASDIQQSEIQILSKLRHPRIVSLLGVVLDVNDYYEAIAGLVTEFMSRGSLYAVLHLDTTPPEHRLNSLSSKLRVLKDIADGMLFLHMSDVIHLDLKSLNVLLDDCGRAKICDFGVSKLLSAHSSHASACAATPAWSSPESFMTAGVVRQSTDIYSFGVILWEILTNRIPWDGVHPFKIAIRLSRGESLPLPESASAPSGLVAMLESCLEQAPNNRPTFQIIVEYLAELLTECLKKEGGVPCPNAYMCPISHEIMDDPVTCSDGHTYDRVNIELWLQRNDTSPLTNVVLKNKTLLPNIALRRKIIEER